ncbi:MAG: hypothetical protein IPJ46_23575 [Anaerolineales bacterium]|nr:hypothetical protein [Anaerolineales bacterium]
MDLRERPDNNDFYSSYIVTRRQISPLLLFKKYGAWYVPPAAENIFLDVAMSDPDIDFIGKYIAKASWTVALPFAFFAGSAITSEELAVIF